MSDVDGKNDPWFIHADAPLWDAGLWEGTSPLLPADNLSTFTIITGYSSGVSARTLTDANVLTKGIHGNRRKGSRDNVTLWGTELRAAVKWLQRYRDERMQAHGRPIPIKPEQRRLVISESGIALTESALDSAWQRMIRRAIAEGVIEKDQRFALHGLKHRGSLTAKTRALVAT